MKRTIDFKENRLLVGECLEYLDGRGWSETEQGAKVIRAARAWARCRAKYNGYEGEDPGEYLEKLVLASRRLSEALGVEA